MTRPPIVAAVAAYLLALVIALRIFLIGHHAVALLIVVGVWV